MMPGIESVVSGARSCEREELNRTSAFLRLALGRIATVNRRLQLNARRTITLLVSTLAITAPALAGNPANLLFPLDASWSVVPFAANGAQGNGPAAPADPLQRNDDDFAQAGTGMPAVPFSFNLYGTNYTGNQIFVNNNGNLSFGAGFTTFTATGFPINNFPMVAPFWADVDTRNTASGVAYYKYFGTNTLVVTWDNVGYYNQQADKTNTFQVAISDGTNPTMGLGNNVCFSYDDMQWTTGSASGGVGGFGGTPATVGVNAGNGVNFFQIGRFDHEGVDYDGPGGNPDGVSFLDGLDTCFRVGEIQNQPPVPIGFPLNDKLNLDVLNGDVLNAVFQFIGPELGDLVNVVVQDLDGAQAAGLVINNTSPGNPANVTFQWVPDLADVGDYDFVFTATDSFGAQTVQNLRINVTPEPTSLALLALGGLLIRRRNRA